MAILNFSDVLRKVGLDPSKVKLIRHALTDKGFKACYDANKVYEYTCHQGAGFSLGYEYWVTFISDSGTLCKLHSCYKVLGFSADTSNLIPDGVPEIEAEKFQGENAYFNLEPVDLLQEYENRLIIDWGKSARMWHQKGTTEKAIVSIQGDVFPGFERLCISFDKLQMIVKNQHGFEAWYTAMASVNAIYLIVDRKTGMQYVGSAYNQNGLWGRWSVYVATGGHGGNKKMMQSMKETPGRCHDLQFSVLQVLPKNMAADEIIQTETLWKEKLLTKEFGWNDN